MPGEKLPPDQPNAAAAATTVEVKPQVEEKPGLEAEAEAERQSTKEWLRSLGVVAGDVATREAPRVEREAARREAPAERVNRGRDTDEVLNLLREGDDERFIEGVVDLSRKRVLGELTRTERDAAFGQKINEYVHNTAPDVPLVVFWSFAERAERTYPTDVAQQIDAAISWGRAAMSQHNEMTNGREQAIRQTQEQSDTLDGTPTRQRRRGGREQEGKTTTFVEELLAARAKYE